MLDRAHLVDALALPVVAALLASGPSGQAATLDPADAAAGIAPLHLGSDGAGSIRIPAAFTGIVGLKPSFGRVPAHPRRRWGNSRITDP
jgi:Asp-tRNA(Asn)/Glu-tRNA(Gln) amidotransferase A subunit family amidase